MNDDKGPLQLSEGLACDIRAAIHRYDGAMPVATAIGVLEIVKAELMDSYSIEEDEDD
ncbi:hypothetical protein ABS755_07880 [Castellaniella sp. FW104-16D08]|uniref:hypothetical protein n=1 Tax=unclassified Castellaniella TaxID=2617606 RepID=UPI0033149405